MVYFNSKDDNKMLSCDWLSFCGYLTQPSENSLPDLLCPDGYRVELLQGNNIFKFRAILYDFHGDKILTVLWMPKSSMMKYNLALFEVANQWLYCNGGIERAIKLSSEMFDYTFASITRLDLCVDFYASKKRLKIIEGLRLKRYYVGAKREGNIWWHSEVGDDYIHDINFGSRKSSFKWKLYDKSREIDAIGECKKPHILSCWIENEMPIHKIWRLEVSITKLDEIRIEDKTRPLEVKHGCVIYLKRCLSLSDLNDETFYLLYSDFYHRRFQLRKNEGHTRTVNDTRVFLFKMDLVRFTFPKVTKETEKRDNSMMYRLIEMINNSHGIINNDVFNGLANALFFYVKFNHLDNLFIKNSGCDVEEWLSQKAENVGCGLKNML